MIKLAVFDMDGTLCDTIEDLGTAVNHALGAQGFEKHTTEEYKTFVGDGVTKLIERALPQGVSDDIVEKTRGMFLDYYKEHFTVFTKPYDGINELLDELKKRKIQLAVFTNKVHYMALKVAEILFGGRFGVVIGQSDEKPMKPDPTAVFEIMDRYGIPPDETVFIGDSDVDMQTAVNSKTHGIGAGWGFRTEKELKENGAEFYASTPLDIINYIDSI